MNLTPLTDLFMDFAASSWRAAWLIVVLVGLRLLVRGRIPAGIWFVAWLVVGVRLLIPFSVPVPWSPYNFTAIRTPAIAQPKSELPGGAIKALPVVVPVATPDTVATHSLELDVSKHPQPVSNPTMSWPRRGMIAWLLGMLLLGATRAVAWERFRRSVLRATPADARVAAIIEREAQVTGVRLAVNGYETTAVDAPALYGIRRPRLLFPAGFAAQLDDEHLTLVVRHELAHWRRRDLLAQALMQAAVVLHWYNPLVWIAARLARIDCELACDAAVLRRENAEGRMAYGSALLRVVALARGNRRSAAAIAIFSTKRHLAHRVRMIAGYRASTAGRVCGGVVLIALLAAASFTREARGAERPGLRTLATTEEVPANDTASPAAASTALTTINEKMEAQARKVEELSQALDELRRKTGPLDQQRDMSNDALKAASLEYQNANSAMQAAEVRLNLIREYREKGGDLIELPFIAEQKLVATLKQQLATQNAALKQLAERYREGHPKMIESQFAVKSTEKELVTAVDACCRQVEVEYDAARRLLGERMLDRDRLAVKAVALEQSAGEVSRLERQLRVQEQTLQTLQARAQETSTEQRAMTAGAWPAKEETFQVSVVGAVNKQNAVELTARDHPIVLDAIARAGGFSPFADRGAMRIIRSMPDGRRETLTLTEDVVMTGTDPAARVQRGDVIVVPERAPEAERFANVSGAVNTAGRVPLRRGMTVADVIAAVGGPSRLANLKRVTLTRRNKETKIDEATTIDVEPLLKGTGGPHADAARVIVEADDWIFIPERVL